MTLTGFIRSVQAAQRRAERESRRRQRELERQEKQYALMEELERAAYEVECYENKINLLSSVHKECGNSWDWEKIKDAKSPSKPVNKKKKESEAKAKLGKYAPGFWDKTFKRIEKKRERLNENIITARKEDEKKHKSALATFEKKYKDWEESKHLAEKILSGDLEFYKEAVNEIDPFSEISQLGSSLSIEFIDAKTLEVSLKTNSEEVIPAEVKSFLKSGKLAVKKMPKGQFYELYQDYICGCVLRVGRESFAMLPIDMVIVHAMGKLLNTKTGHMEEQPVLSVAIPRETLETFNFDMIDPSDSMSNFVHHMNFKKTKGFSAVEKVEVSDFC